MLRKRTQTAMLGILLAGAVHCSDPVKTVPSTDQFFDTGADFAGSHILIAYQGSERADPSVTRTREEAREKARELIDRLMKDPSKFADLARTESDGPSAPQGGSLGSWRKGRMVPEFDTAIEKLEVGQITPEPVETAFGFHVIIREETRQQLWAAWGLILAWDGAQQVQPKTPRSQEEARQLAASLAAELNTANFEEQCARVSDVGPAPTFIGPMSEEALANPVTGALLEGMRGLGFDEVGGPVETPSGFVFLKRIELQQRAGAHILISYEGAQGADETVTRTREEARQRAEDLISQLEDDPSNFPHFAREESDGISARNGGNLGIWFKGRMTPEIEVAIDRMAVGEISSRPVETPFGYHILHRLPIERQAEQ